MVIPVKDLIEEEAKEVARELGYTDSKGLWSNVILNNKVVKKKLRKPKRSKRLSSPSFKKQIKKPKRRQG